MSYVKRIVCLANSYKPGGRCVAGREILENKFGAWIRPVSDRATAELWPLECRYEDNRSPKLLDIIDVPLLKPDPRHHQTENHVIAAGQWKKVGEIDWNALKDLTDQPAALWINDDHTKGPGHHACIAEAKAFKLTNSLMLIQPQNFRITIGPHYYTQKRTFRASFDYGRTHYNLSMTDPVARDAFAEKEEGSYELSHPYVCVSLTESYEKDNRCYKLVAGIMMNPPL